MQPLIGTGLSGLIGTRFQQLYGKAYECTNLDLTAGVDITSYESVDAAIAASRADAIIHLAAFTNVSAAFEQAGDKSGTCYQVNVTGTENLAKAAAKYHKFLIHISTDYVFDGTKADAYTEEDAPHPIEWYGDTKYLAEKAVQELAEKWVILRLAFPYQAHPMRPDFLATIKTGITEKTLRPAFTDHILTPTFADDIAKVFDYCIQHQPSGIYHCVGSSWHSDFEIANLVNEIFALNGEVKPGSLAEYLKTTSRPYQQTMKVSNAKLQREFGITMRTLDEGLKEVKAQLG